MKTPEKLSVVPSCPGMGNCAACGRCPFAERFKAGSVVVESLTSGKIISFSEFKVGKQKVWQSLSVPSVFPGLPVPEKIVCQKCKNSSGSCPEHQKAA